MRRVVLLDTGPLGKIVNQRKSPEVGEWLDRLVDAGEEVLVPEIADYELRRGLLRLNDLTGVKRLDDLYSVIGYVLWNRALSGLPAAVVGASLYAQPILGAGLSWLLLRDPLPPTFVPGAVLVLAGVYIASSARRRAPAVPL